MSLRYCSDLSAASWIVESGTPDMQLILFGPACFPAYARVRFIADPVGPGQAESDADVGADHPPDVRQAGRTLRGLAEFTSTPQDCYFCLWEGYSDVPLPPDARRGPLLVIPHRRYAVFRGALSDVDGWAHAFGDGSPIPPPAFVWPADRSWCFASDVDPHWAGVGGSHAAVAALIDDPLLDAVAADPAGDQPWYC